MTIHASLLRQRFEEGFLLLDVETTGFLPDGEIIQISVYDFTGAERLTTYVRPTKPIDETSGAFVVNYGLMMAYLIQTTAAAANPTGSWTGSANAAAVIGSFKPAAGGPAAAFLPAYSPGFGW